MRITGARLRRIIKEELSRSLLNEAANDAAEVPESADKGLELLGKWRDQAQEELSNEAFEKDLSADGKKINYLVEVLEAGDGKFKGEVSVDPEGNPGDEDEDATEILQKIVDRDLKGRKHKASDGSIVEHTALSAGVKAAFDEYDIVIPVTWIGKSYGKVQKVDMDDDTKSEGITRSDIRQLILREMRRRR